MSKSKRANVWKQKVGRGIIFGVAAPIFALGLSALGAKGTAAQGGNSQLVVQLGGALFAEKDLSNPVGQACISCHSPEVGFSFPLSAVNEQSGIAPGAVPGRFGNRRPPSIAYAKFIPPGPPSFDARQQTFVGGLFYDGRAPNLPSQAAAPLQNPNEMNNLVHNLGSPALVVSKVESGPNAELFKQTYGANVFTLPASQVFQMIVQAIATFESSPTLSPFSSKYDAYVAGRATLTANEMAGLRLFTGSSTGRPGGPPYKNAECSTCHVLAPGAGRGPDLFTDFHYYNIGIPRNPANPYYKETDAAIDPAGYNPLGINYIDLGLADFLYSNGGLVPNDPLAIKGKFKAPTLRNTDTRPYPEFVKAYGHNGVFKSLQQVVHFYNTRNLTTAPGEVIDFTKTNPYLGLRGRPLWSPPEVLSAQTLINPSGQAGGPGRHLGNLGLSSVEEAQLVDFLTTLSDGYFSPGSPGTPTGRP
jgi:cytochrome c peroxidase